MQNTVGTPDWSTIPAPHDDGATDHLPTFEVSGMTLLKRFTWSSPAAPWSTCFVQCFHRMEAQET